jgi:dUTP pyrophosphatase
MWLKIKSGHLSKETTNSAGWDLCANEDISLLPGHQAVIGTGLRTEFTPGYVGLIRDRSGMAAKKRGTTRAGVIDADYKDEWKVVFVNESMELLEIKKGDRIAQVLFIPVPWIEIYEEGGTYEVKDVQRAGGFGSTGK